MTTYQTYLGQKMEVTTYEIDRRLNVLFAALFLTAVFMVPTGAAIAFLFI